MKKKITIGFRGVHKHYSQTPLLMIVKEYWEDNKVEFAEVLFEFDINMRVNNKKVV